MFTTNEWKDYEVLDVGDGEKLERWGGITLRRPDPQVIWPKTRPDLWRGADAWYHRSERGGGDWEFYRRLPDKWVVEYRGLKFYVRPTGFKHTGLFPEQAANWDWMESLISQADRPISVLNLFGYTGGATLACARAGAKVTHVDAAKGMMLWAGENRALNHLDESKFRWIVDDAGKFAAREERRGNRYDAILMDPPSYGRGPGGEVWKLEDELYGLVKSCSGILSDSPLFFLINSYTTGLQPAVLSNILYHTMPRGHVDSQELVLPVTAGGILPCGASGRWTGK